MSWTLIVDGEITASADEDAIRRGFGSIEPGEGWRKGISIVDLRCDDARCLGASGHPTEGWCHLCREDGDEDLITFPEPPLTSARAIEIFCAYRRGDLAWAEEFEWQRQKTFRPSTRTIVRNLAVMGAVFVILVLLLRWWHWR